VKAAVVPTEPLNSEILSSASGSISVSWTSPEYDGGSSITGYRIYYKTNPSLVWSSTALLSSRLFTSTLSPITADTEYMVKIAAENSEGSSIASNVLY
jgi:hypothetical protein